eukprot:COSAG03_NODE_11254_length_603_cov_0.878968_2_plen_78_part_00
MKFLANVDPTDVYRATADVSALRERGREAEREAERGGEQEQERDRLKRGTVGRRLRCFIVLKGSVLCRSSILRRRWL